MWGIQVFVDPSFLDQKTSEGQILGPHCFGVHNYKPAKIDLDHDFLLGEG